MNHARAGMSHLLAGILACRRTEQHVWQHGRSAFVQLTPMHENLGDSVFFVLYERRSMTLCPVLYANTCGLAEAGHDRT